MNITDSLTITYQVVAATATDLSGFREDIIMLAKNPIDGSDLGSGSNWTISKVKNDKYHFHPLNARSIWTRRICPLPDIRTNFIPLR